ncbi:MAG: protein kinase, partial [Kofleriaceae bacterium]
GAGTGPDDGSPLAPAEDGFVGEQIARYRITRLLGKGGMGRVYLAVQPDIGSRVAVKVLSDEWADAPDVLERFFAEARTVSLISHENIIKVIDLDRTSTGRPYIVMEYVAGKTLRDVIELGTAPLGGIVHVMTEVLLALDAAHRAGVVHRDLKPDNVMVTESGHAKVLDFGIAKLATDRGTRTRTGAAIGTPPYMAPEQIQGEPIDARTDLYAAGVMTYELVTGHRPFGGATDFQIMQEHVHRAPPSPRAMRPSLPEAFEAVILQALAKRPADRFSTARAMAHALRIASAELPAREWRHLSSAWVDHAPSASFDALPAVAGEPTMPVLPPHAEPPHDTPTRPDRGPGRLDHKTRTLEPAPAMRPSPSIRRPEPPVVQRASAPAPRRRRLVLGLVALLVLGGVIALIAQVARGPAGVAVASIAADASDPPADVTPIAVVTIDAAVAPVDAAGPSAPNDGGRVPRPTRDAAVIVAAAIDAPKPAAAPPRSRLGNPPIVDEPTIPPRRSQTFDVAMPAADLEHFDPAAWAPVAQSYARMLEPDAELTVLDALVRDDGSAYVGSSNVRLNFRSEAAVTANDSMRLPCIVVRPSSRGLRIIRYDHCNLKTPLARLPRCKFPAVFPGKVPKHAEARSVNLTFDAAGWRVEQYREKPEAAQLRPLERKTVPDDC